MRRLENAIADFKAELEVFLAARTPSNAAVAQQKLDTVWTVLAQLPVYENITDFSRGSHSLFHTMREYPDRTDDSVTEGTNFYAAMTHWLGRLNRLPGAVDDFIRNTFLMLADYFENLPSRSPTAYAEAYEKYRRMMNTAFQFAAEEDVIAIRLFKENRQNELGERSGDAPAPPLFTLVVMLSLSAIPWWCW